MAMILDAPHVAPSFCFPVLPDPSGNVLADQARRPTMWACHGCRRVTTPITEKVCRVCGHRRCNAPQPIFGRAYRTEVDDD